MIHDTKCIVNLHNYEGLLGDQTTIEAFAMLVGLYALVEFIQPLHSFVAVHVHFFIRHTTCPITQNDVAFAVVVYHFHIDEGTRTRKVDDENVPHGGQKLAIVQFEPNNEPVVKLVPGATLSIFNKNQW